MKLLFSVPNGYHLRELLLPLRPLLEADNEIEKVFCMTPAARHKKELFSAFSDKFEFIENPSSIEGHATLFRRLQINLVVTDTVGHDEHDYPALVAAKQAGIRSLTFIASWDNVWKIGRLLNDKKPVALADNIIVWNQMMSAHLRQLFPSLAKEQVSVVGAPRLDYFFHPEKIPSKAALFRFLGLDDVSRPLIHVATTELYPMDYVVADLADETSRHDSRPYIYASVHPGGKLDNHQNLKQYGALVRYSFGRRDHASHPAFLYNPTEQDVMMLVSLFVNSTLLINHSSSTALESLIAGVPVINIKYGRPLDWWRWYRSMVYRDFHQHYRDLVGQGATYVVKSRRQFRRAVSDILSGKKKSDAARLSTVSRMITTTDGSAGKKVIKVIKELIDKY